MKILDKNTGEWKTIQIGGNSSIDYDNLPVGSIIDFDGDEVPAGYELSEDGADGGTWIGDDTPTNAYNLWIKPSEKIDPATEVVNTLNGNEINLAPSVKVVNDTVNYSKEETVIGKWIDGKPLYRRVVIIKGITIKPYDYNIKGLNIDHVMLNKSTLYNDNGTTQWCFPMYHANTDDEFRAFKRTEGSAEVIRINVGAQHAMSSNIITLIMEYTKTTD